MNINKTNIQEIHNVVYTDLQRLMFRQYNARKDEFNITDEDYDVTQELLINKVLHCDSLNDVNDMLLTYEDLFPNEQVFTLEGTMNYLFKLLR